MDLSIFLAQVFGVYMLFVGIVVLIRGKEMRKVAHDFAKNSGLVYGLGVFVFILGLIIVLSHNIWDGTWRTVVTILGWLTLLEGAAYLLLGQSVTVRMVKFFDSKAWYVGGSIVSILLGVYLIQIGFDVSLLG